MTRSTRFAFTLVAIGALAAAPVRAQTLSGRIIDAASGAPVSGGFIKLIDADGKRSVAWLTDAAGVYRLKAASPGRYTVQIERLGYSTFTSEPFSLDSATTRDFRLPAQAIELASITAAGSSRCGDSRREPMTAETALLWDEVRKALALTSWTEHNAVVQFDLVDRKRTLDTRMMSRGVEETTTSGVKRGSPFAARAADSLLTRGFIQPAEGGHFTYYAPDAELIMSDAFQATHCFYAKTDRRKSGMVGLVFVPTGDVKPYDVRGTIWLDRKSMLLTSLEFTYDRTPVDVPETAAGGEVAFTRFDTGMWIVSGWTMRVPIIERVNTSTGLRPVLTYVAERSQYVKSARISGRLVYTDSEHAMRTVR